MEIIRFKLTKDASLNGTENLYYRLENGAYMKSNEINMPINSTVSLDTYFNVLSTKYFRYAIITNPQAEVKFIGDIDLEIRLKTEGKDELLAKRNFISKEIVSAFLNFSLSEIVEGFIYIKIISNKQDTRFLGGGFTCDTIPRKINLGVVICTFKREKYVLDNLNKISQYFKTEKALKEKLTVFVVDNGKTLEKDILPKENVRLIPNENTGGAGGFTKGLKEIIKDGAFSHFLFMDDDLYFDPIILLRTLTLLSILRPEYEKSSIGGGMLILDNPTIQHESGGFWNGINLRSNANNVDVSTTNGLLENEKIVSLDYNAWWYMCMPISTVDDVGLPLERIFIKGDDIEYGLRGIKTLIVINGIGVWHENFNYKYIGQYEYFSKRNELIVNSRFPRKKGLMANFIKYVKGVSKALVEQRYFTIDLIDRAYMDFLKGYDYIAQIDSVKLLAEFKALFPQQIPVEEFESQNEINIKEEFEKTLNKKPKTFIQVITLNSYLLPKCTYQDIAVVEMVKPRPISFYKVKKCISYNSYTQSVFVTEIKKTKIFYAIGKIIKMFFNLIFKFRKAKKSYRF